MLDSFISATLDTRDLVVFLLDNRLYRTISFTLVGTLIGSFLSVVIYRLPMIIKERAVLDTADFFPGLLPEKQVDIYSKGTNLGGFSKTPCCNNAIRVMHNIPVLSWLLLQGTCSYCGEKISPRYITLELMTAILFGVTAYIAPNKEVAFLTSGVSAVLISISFIDFEETLIPDELNFLIVVLSLYAIHYSLIDTSILEALGSAIGTLLCLTLLNIASNRAVGLDALGGGDIKLMAAIAMLVGTTTSLFITAISIIAISATTKLMKEKTRRYYPLGPYLAVITWFKVVYML